MTASIEHLVAGQWRGGTGQQLHSINPARPDEVVAQGRSATPGDVDDAVSAAAGALGGWSATPIHTRGAVLAAAAAVVDLHAEQWGLELAAEEGKTRAEGVGEVRRAAQILRYYAGEGDRLAGEIFASPRAGEQILVTRKPVGVIGVVTPFNFPIAIPAWKIVPALVYGNTVVWKPASSVPLLAIRLAQALTEGGLPTGVLNLLIGDSGVGNAIVDHDGIAAITFTGSTGVGRRIAAAAAARGVAMQAEMGGKNAAVVLDDADFDLAVEQVHGHITFDPDRRYRRQVSRRHRGARRRIDGRRSHRRPNPDGARGQRFRAGGHHRRHRHRQRPGRDRADRRRGLQRRAAVTGLLRGTHRPRTRRPS
jgi:aldehyde dehydrogenase (NAD+)